MAGLYILGIVMGILIALFYKGTLFKGEAVPFVMELRIIDFRALKCKSAFMGKSQRLSAESILRNPGRYCRCLVPAEL